MKFTVKRFVKERTPQTIDMSYETKPNTVLLKALQTIKATKDSSLTFGHNCQSGVCGACAVRVNDQEVLACEYIVQEGDYVQPLRNGVVQKDLLIDLQHTTALNKLSRNSIHASPTPSVSQDNANQTAKQSDCILCSACHSVCPVYATNSAFLGPFALTRSFRYVMDERNDDASSIIEAITQNGIWDCTLCGECTRVCPQHIDSKTDILMLQTKAGVMGYENPHFSSGFGEGFTGGFNPQSF